MPKPMTSEVEASFFSNSVRMLAHDVRKPFTILKIGLSILESAENFEHFKKLSSELKPNIINNLNRVSKMLEDLLNKIWAQNLYSQNCDAIEFKT